MELTVSLTLFAMLLVSLAVLFGWGIKAYFYMISDWQVQRDVQFAMQRISEDVRFGENFSCDGDKLIVQVREDAGIPIKVIYELTKETYPRVRRNSQPLTGESTLGRAVIEDLNFEAVGERTVFYSIRVRNELTGHPYEMRSAMTLLNKAVGSP